MSKQPCIYIIANKKNGTLYTGVTGNLIQRIHQHKQGLYDGFTKKYSIHGLVYYELCPTMESAILKEKQLKGGNRQQKIDLITSMNAEREDLYDQIVG